MSTSVSLYNPRDTDPEQLEKMLTGRSALLEEILEDLRGQAGGSTRQHWLLRGQRGMGKTHLTGVIHYRVRTDSMLQKVYLPLWLGEADVYEVYSTATLLVKVAERLKEETGDETVLQRMGALEGVGDEEAFFEAMLELLSGEAERRDRVLLVLMENLDALLESFAPKERATQTRQLRSVLLHNPRFLFISTTPTRYLRSLSNPKEPLYGHLKERDLSPLTEQEMGDLFQKLVELTGRKELEAVLLGAEGPLRVRVIHQLTGGLPRSVIMAFTVMQGGAGLRALIEGLRKFLDAQTAYFEARLARLAPRERAIVTTMALARENLTLKEIAQRSRLPERTLSTHIQRLEADGHVRPVSGSVGKGSLYELSEGLFRLWYQFRRGQMVLEPLVAFIATWFRAEEIETLVHEHRRRRDESTPMQRRAAELALLQIETAFQRATSEEGRRQRERLWESARNAITAAELPADESIEEFLRQAVALFEEGEPEDAMRGLLDLWERQGRGRARLLAECLIAVWRAAFEKTERGSHERELKIHQLVISYFSQRPEAVFLPYVLAAFRWNEAWLLGVLERYAEGLVKTEELIGQLQGNETKSVLFGLAILTRGWFLGELEKVDESLMVIEGLLRSPPYADKQAEVALACEMWRRVLAGKLTQFMRNEVYWRRCQEVLWLYVDRFYGLDDGFVGECVARTLVLLVALDSVHAREPWREIDFIDDCLRRYDPGESEQSRRVVVISQYARVVAFLSIRNFQKIREGFDAVLNCLMGATTEAERELVVLVFGLLPRILAAVGPRQMNEWFNAFELPWLDANSRQQLEFHQYVARLLLAEGDASKLTKKARQDQMDLLRVPPELRKTLESTVRQVHKLKKDMGAEW